MPTNETKIALMSILEMASFRKMWDIMATAKGDVAIITVPIDRGRILNEYVIIKKPTLPRKHLKNKGSNISRVIPWNGEICFFTKKKNEKMKLQKFLTSVNSRIVTPTV